MATNQEIRAINSEVSTSVKQLDYATTELFMERGNNGRGNNTGAPRAHAPSRSRTKYHHLTIWVPDAWEQLDADARERATEQFFDCDALHEYVQYVRWQLERCPTTLRLHIQAAIQWRDREGLRGLYTRFGIPNARFHSEPITYNWDSFANYASKERTRVGRTAYEWGTFTSPTISTETGERVPAREDLKFAGEFLRRGSVGELAAIRPDLVIKYVKGLEATKRYLEQHGHGRRRPQARRTYVLCGPTGTGKTSGIFKHYAESQVFGPPIPQGGVQWFDGLSGQKVLVLDEFEGAIPYGIVKRICDPYHNEVVPIKGAHGMMVADVIFIISNKMPWHWWSWKDMAADQFPELDRRVTQWVWFGEGDGPIGLFPIKWIRKAEFDWGVGCTSPCLHVSHQ